MNDIYDNINETMTLIDSLIIPRKFKGDKLHALEFNDVVDKINEIRRHLNGPVRDTIIETTSYILDKINNVQLSLRADIIPLNEDSTKSILDEIPGVGKKRKQALLAYFDNLDAIYEASPEEIAKVDGISEKLALTIFETLENDKNNKKGND